MAETLYTIDILRLAASTAQWPPLATGDGSAERRSPTCGSRVAVDVTCDGAGHVLAVGLTVSACALGQAASAIMAAHAPGRDAAGLRAAHDHLSAWMRGEGGEMPDWPDIAMLAPARDYPARHASILLAFDAVAAAAEASADAVQARSHVHG